MTTKLGSSDKRPGTQTPVAARDCRMYAGEMIMSLFVLTAAFYGIFSVNKWSFSIFLTLQGMPPCDSITDVIYIPDVSWSLFLRLLSMLVRIPASIELASEHLLCQLLPVSLATSFAQYSDMLLVRASLLC